MPSASELERVEQERVTFDPATVFEITLQFGRHQMKLSVDIEVIDGSDAEAITHYLAEHMEPHITEMLAAEDRQRKIDANGR